MIIRTKSKPPVPPLPGGTYVATCIFSIDIGEQLCKYKDTEKYNNQVVLGFEIAGQTVEIDGKQEPRVLSRTFTVSMGANSGLRKFVGGWLGQKFDDSSFGDLNTNDLVGLTAMLSVVLSEDKMYANIDSAMQIPQGIPITVPAPTSPLIRFDLDPFDQKAFDALPEWAQERIKKSTDWAKSHADTSTIEVKPEAGGIYIAAMLSKLGNVPKADPATGEVIEEGAADSSTPLRSAQNDRRGGAPF